MLLSAYPNYQWLPWKFNQTPKGYWKDIQNQRKCLDYLAKELNVKELDDWYNIGFEVSYLFFISL